MTLRDYLGEVEVGIGDLLAYKEAVLSVVCPEDSLYEIIVVRLHSGVLDEGGLTFDAATAKDVSRAGFPIQPLFRFSGELVAHCVRAYRLLEPVPVDLSQAGVSKRTTARPRPKDQGKAQPASASDTLF